MMILLMYNNIYVVVLCGSHFYSCQAAFSVATLYSFIPLSYRLSSFLPFLRPHLSTTHSHTHFVYPVNKTSTYYRYYTQRALSTFKTYVIAWKNFCPAKSLLIHSSQMIKVFHVHSILSFYSISISSVWRRKTSICIVGFRSASQFVARQIVGARRVCLCIKEFHCISLPFFVWVCTSYSMS